MSGDQEFTGGLVEGTKVFLANGKTVPIENIKVGDEVLTYGGGAAKVEARLKGYDDLVTIRQKTNHRADLQDLSVRKSLGIMEMTCSKRQPLILSTKQRIGIRKDGRPGVRLVSVSQLADCQTTDGRVIKIIKETTKRFPLTTKAPEIIDYVEPMVLRSEGGCFNWQCQAGDFDVYVNKKDRAGTRMLLQPISIEIPVLGPWLEQCFERNITAQQLEAMAWLLGFWIGDGSTRGAIFSLNIVDEDVNTRLEKNAEIWGMTLTKKRRSLERGNGLGADGYLHTYNGADRLWNKNNPLVKVLDGLEFRIKFYENGKKNYRKSVPLFMQTEQIVVREAFLAGLIDSDGYCKIQYGSIRVTIPTAYQPIRDGINFIGRSLCLTVSTHFRGAYFNERSGKNHSNTWTFNLYGGTNDETLWSILNRCSCARKRNPPIAYRRDRDFEEFDSDYQSEENEYDPEDNDDFSGIMERFEDDAEEQEDGTFNFGKIFFNIVQKDRKGKVIGLVLSGTSNRTFVTDDQIVCATAELITESRTDFERRCLSCHKTSSEWRRVPWLEDVEDRMCRACWAAYSRTHMRCSNDLCNYVFRKREVATGRCELCDSSPLQG